MTRVFIASDHGGLPLKSLLLQELGDAVDLGTNNKDSVDYPDFAQKLCREVLLHANEKALGVLICGTGIGVSIAANRFSGIRAALCHDVTTAKLARLHNDANVLCLGARVIGPVVAAECLHAFLNTAFEGGRHIKRIEKIEAACDLLCGDKTINP